MPKILIPSPLRKFTGNAAEVVVAGGTVGEALKSLAELHPELHQQIFTAEGKIRSFVNVYHNDEDIRFLDKEATVTADGDIVTLVPSIAGGSQVATAALSNEELERYSRHLILPEVGVEGQLKLKASKVLLVGTGGLGSPLALYLAAAGVGTLGLVDFDIVDYSNLQRQVIHGTSDIGRKKLDSAEDSIRELNPNVRVVRHDGALTSENALGIIKDYDVVADGTDNFPTRYSGFPSILASAGKITSGNKETKIRPITSTPFITRR